MKRKIFCLLLPLFLSGIFLKLHAQQFPENKQLQALIEKGEYFQFHTAFEKILQEDYNKQNPNGLEDQVVRLTNEEIYFCAWDYFLFNYPKQSNNSVNYLLSPQFPNCPDSIAAELLQLHFQNDLRMFDYKTADSISSLLLSRYSNVISPEQIESIKNSSAITSALKNTPPQTIERNGDLNIKFKRDLASLIRIPVNINGKKDNFILDTGANLSTLSESEAKKMGVKILDGNFGVTSSSRSSVNSKIGVADKIEIGNVIFRNVPFIILPDKSLSFGGGLYKIKGIIGLPVIAQLGEIQIHKDGHIFSPLKQTESDLHNLGMEGNTPFANVNFYGAYHCYIFDTGAATGIYGGEFKTTYADSLKNLQSKSVHVGGAGGMQTISTLKIENLHYEFGSVKGILKRSTVQLAGNEAIFNSFYGIVGEDILMQWKTVTINFDKMFVLLSNSQEPKK